MIQARGISGRNNDDLSDVVQRVRHGKKLTGLVPVGPQGYHAVGSLAPTALDLQAARRGDVPSSVFQFGLEQTKVDSTVNITVSQLLSADTDAQRLAIASHLRRALLSDSQVGAHDVLAAKRRMAGRLAELHTDDPVEVPDQRTFDVYMSVLRELETILERKLGEG